MNKAGGDNRKKTRGWGNDQYSMGFHKVPPFSERQEVWSQPQACTSPTPTTNSTSSSWTHRQPCQRTRSSCTKEDIDKKRREALARRQMSQLSQAKR